MPQVDKNDAASETSKGNEQKKRERKLIKQSAYRVVVRHLPPHITESELLKTMQPPDYSDFYLLDADPAFHPYNLKCAYFDFLKLEDAGSVYKQFDGYVFVDSKGEESIALVEWAPYQRSAVKALSSAKRNDPKYCGMLEDDPKYKTFVEELQAAGTAHEASENVAKMLAEIDAKRVAETKRLETASTPLLEHLWATYVEKSKSRKAAKKTKMRGEKRKEGKTSKQKHHGDGQDRGKSTAKGGEVFIKTNKAHAKAQRDETKPQREKKHKDKPLQEKSSSSRAKEPEEDKKRADSDETKVKQQQRREPRAPQDAQNAPKSERRPPRDRVPKEGASEKTANEERRKRPERQVYTPKARNRSNKEQN